jgi:predicted dienelactone hydrolase
MILMLAWMACSPSEDPAGPAPLGVVGVRTTSVDDLTVEVWYPAHPDHAGEAGESVSFAATLSDDVLERLGPITLPLLPTPAVRDAAPHPDGPFPVVIFSHGFGGSRYQSVSLMTALAEAGFVVVATDHAGRSVAELVPCLFSPPMEGCDLSVDDPAPPELTALADWLEAPPSWLPADPGAMGLLGHSAGGNSVITVADADARFMAVAPMAGGGLLSREVPTQRWAGTCDGIVPEATTREAYEQSVGGSYVTLADAGPLAFSDLCALELGGLVDELSERDDVSTIFLDQARQLAVDGCPGEAPVAGLCDTFLPLEVSEPLLSRGLVSFYSAALRGEGDGSPPDDPALSVSP